MNSLKVYWSKTHPRGWLVGVVVAAAAITTAAASPAEAEPASPVTQASVSLPVDPTLPEAVRPTVAFRTPPAPPGGVRAACAQAPVGYASCLAKQYVPLAPQTALGEGYRPVDLQRAYKLPTSTPSAGTVAITVAYGYPNLEKDLAVYRRTFGLPACTTSTGCLRILDQRGGIGPFPTPDVGWGYETAIDVDAVSATCPSCRIVVVVADDASNEDLTAAVQTATKQDVTAISNSWGAFERPEIIKAATPVFSRPGIAYFAGTGDGGYGGAYFPADLTSVVAVGGTTLTRSLNARGFNETAWHGAGSGCSTYVKKLVVQPRIGCGNKRATADISALADAKTGLAVYDSYNYESTDPAWTVAGGTSLATPLVAGVEATVNTRRTITSAWIYDHVNKFVDVVGGANGDCDLQPICTAVRGYDGPTGVGRPNGVATFVSTVQ